jgi:hypothetical protein
MPPMIVLALMAVALHLLGVLLLTAVLPANAFHTSRRVPVVQTAKTKWFRPASQAAVQRKSYGWLNHHVPICIGVPNQIARWATTAAEANDGHSPDAPDETTKEGEDGPLPVDDAVDSDNAKKEKKRNLILRGIPRSHHRRQRQEYRTWTETYERLVEYASRNGGDTRVPLRYSDDDPSLGEWVIEQRMRYQKGILTAEQKALLDRINFDSESRQEKFDRLWREQFDQMKECTDGSGGPITLSMLRHDPKLYHWAQWQRELNNKNRLRRDRKTQLNNIGFVWVEKNTPDEIGTAIFDRKWDANFATLLTFQKQWGHLIVPNNYVEDPALGHWVSTQRQKYKIGELRSDRLARLQKIGFTFDLEVNAEESLKERLWENMFRRLLDYHETNGHILVSSEDDPELRAWVDSQRWLEREGKLGDLKKIRLDALGMQWSVTRGKKYLWDESFGQLEEFIKEHGLCRIPPSHNPRLSKWTIQQRYKRKQGKLSPDRIERLNSIGFV